MHNSMRAGPAFFWRGAACADFPGFGSLPLAGDAVVVPVQFLLVGGVAPRNVVPAVLVGLGAIGVRRPCLRGGREGHADTEKSGNRGHCEFAQELAARYGVSVYV
jgi:hypothetical protein